MNGSQVCIYMYIYVYIHVYIHTHCCVFTSNNLCWKQLVLWTLWHGTGEGWGVSTKPLCASGVLLCSPPNFSSQAEQWIKWKVVLLPRRGLQFASYSLQCCGDVFRNLKQLLNSFWHSQKKKKKTFIINMSTQPNRLVCMLLSTNLIFKAGGKHSAVFPLTLLLLSHTYKSQNSK